MAQAKKKTATTQLIFADTDTCADAFYLSGIFVPDAFPLIVHKGRKIAILSQLEHDRAARVSTLNDILSLEELRDEVREKDGNERPKMSDIVLRASKKLNFKKCEVPFDFPLGLAEALRNRGLRVEVAEGPLVRERLNKTDAEAQAIRRANVAAAAGIRAAERTLKAAEIRKERLYFDGKPLTSERLRAQIDSACLDSGAVASRTICAGGAQACDPHEGGTGPLRANELIIVDVFPRMTATGYHGDMTRTFLKGKASEAQKALVETVRLAQFAALETIKPGVKAATVHGAASGVFEDAGYETGMVDGRRQGFIHSTGHGLGLDIHEEPRISPYSEDFLSKNMVFTVEPGLYYPQVGGCRIEDVVRVETGGYEMLSKYHYSWLIK